MTHQPKKPPEGGDERHRDVRTRREWFRKLFGGGESQREEEQSETQTPPAEQVARRTRSGFTRRTALAAGAALAVSAVLPSPAHAEGRGGWPDTFVVDRYRVPEWSPEELDKLADAYSLLSQYRINPSFWRYVTNHKMEGPVYQALDAALLYPELVHYKEEKDGVIRIMPRNEPNEFSSIPIGFEIEIKGGLKNGRITRIRINHFDIPINPGASLDWKEYEEIFRQSSQEYSDTLHYLYALDRLILDPNTPIPQVRTRWSSARKLKSVSWTERKLPRKIRAPINKILSEAEIEVGLQGVINTTMPDARKVEGCRRATEKYSFLQSLLGLILKPKNTTDAQKLGQIRTALEARLLERIQAVRTVIQGFDISQMEGAPPTERLRYTDYNDYAEEVTGISARIKELLELHRRMTNGAYLDPATENPASFPPMQAFMERSNLFAYPERQPDGTVVIKIFSMGLATDDPTTPGNEGINLEFQRFIAFDPTGRVMVPTDRSDPNPANRWKKFTTPFAGQPTRDLVHTRFKAQLGL